MPFGAFKRPCQVPRCPGQDRISESDDSGSSRSFGIAVYTAASALLRPIYNLLSTQSIPTAKHRKLALTASAQQLTHGQLQQHSNVHADSEPDEQGNASGARHGITRIPGGAEEPAASTARPCPCHQDCCTAGPCQWRHTTGPPQRLLDPPAHMYQGVRLISQPIVRM